MDEKEIAFTIVDQSCQTLQDFTETLNIIFNLSQADRVGRENLSGLYNYISYFPLFVLEKFGLTADDYNEWRKAHGKSGLLRVETLAPPSGAVN